MTESADHRPQHLPLAPGTRVLITGGAGFLGSHLAEALLDRGCRVAVIDNLSTGRFDNIRHLTPNARFSFAIDSITNEAVLDHLIGDCDLIYHLAAVVGVELIVKDPVSVLESNVFGARAVLAAANRYKKPVLITSSSEVYGKSERVPFAEDDDQVLGPTTRARWSYATSKTAIEHLGLAYHRRLELPVIIARLFNVVGPRQRARYGMVIPRFVRQALAGEPLTVYGDGRQRRSFCDVSDAVRALVLLAEHPQARGRVFNVGATREIAIRDLAGLVLRLVTGEPPSSERITLVPYDRVYGPGFEDMQRRLPDVSRIQALTGWRPTVPLEDTLRRVIASLGGPAAGRPIASPAVAGDGENA
ncbi:MAG: NAD-dependent epimerase/dehydratase family protein [Acidobacteria bacterium]|nr:MAG: NAD-dependent epimerase/dehydratase family protein [Acidobacteriota bacterium]